MQKDRAILIEIDKKKNEQIKKLEEQVASLKAQKQPKASVPDTKSRAKEEELKKQLTSKESEHKKALATKESEIKKLQSEKSTISKDLDQAKTKFQSKQKDFEKLQDQNKKLIQEIAEKDKKLKDLEIKVKRKPSIVSKVDSQNQEVDFTYTQTGSFHGENSPMKSSANKKPNLPPGAGRERSFTQKQARTSEINSSEVKRYESQITTIELQAERDMIEKKLNEVSIRDVEDRSDMELSQMKSYIPGVTQSEISGPNIGQPNQFMGYIDEKSVIKEDENENTETMKDEFVKAKLIGSQSVVVNQPRKITSVQPNNPVLDQLKAQIPSDSKLFTERDECDEVSEFTKGSIVVKQLKFVERHEVDEGFKRLGRLLQLRRCRLDKVEEAIFDVSCPGQSVKITELSEIFVQKLALTDQQAIDFARFLIEEKDEDHPEVDTIEYRPNRMINQQYIPVRLMAYFGFLPSVYTDKQDEECKKEFLNKFDTDKQKQLVKKINKLEDAIVSFEIFKKIINDINVGMDEQTIDNIFIQLCRGSETSGLKRAKSPEDINVEYSEKVQGFDSQNIFLIFKDLDQGDISEDYSDEEYTAQVNESVERYTSVDEEVQRSSLVEDIKNDSIVEAVVVEDQKQDDQDEIKKMAQAMREENQRASQQKLEANYKSEQVPKASTASLEQSEKKDDSSFQPPIDSNQFNSNMTVPAVEFTFNEGKQKTEDTKKEEVEKEAIPEDDDRSDNSFDQQESMAPDQLEKFQFGKKGEQANALERYDNQDKEIIKEQSRESLNQESSKKKFELGADDDEPQKKFELVADDNEIDKAELEIKDPTEKPSTNRSEVHQNVSILDQPDESSSKKDETAPETTQEVKDQAEAIASKDEPQAKKDEAAESESKEQPKEELKALEELKDDPQTKKEEPAKAKEEDQQKPEDIKQQDQDDQYEYYDEEDDGEAKEAPADKPLSAESPEAKKPLNVTEEQIVELKKVLRTILNSKINVELQQMMEKNISQIDTVIQISSEIFVKFAESILKNFPELRENCRDIFREIIYSNVEKVEVKEDEVKKVETEVIRLVDLISKLDDQQYPETLKQNQVVCLQTILSTPKFNGMILYSDMQNIMATMGILDHKVPLGQKTTSHLDYTRLDLKSIRIMNRMIHFLGSKDISFTQFMGDIIVKQEVKTKNQQQEVEIFYTKKFFKKLLQHGIKKSSKPHQNLCDFLCIDKKYKNYLMLKKLKRCIIDFNESSYFQSIGLKKMKLNQNPGESESKNGDYEYYDEEDDDVEESNGKNSKLTSEMPMGSIANKSEKPMSLNQPAEEEKQDEEYEYYDEEDDDK